MLRWIFPDDSINEHVLKSNLQLYAHTLILICLKNNVKNKYVQVEPLELELNQRRGISTMEIFTLTSYESDLLLREDEHEVKSYNGKCNAISWSWSLLREVFS